jgi:hypothetical protein
MRVDEERDAAPLEGVKPHERLLEAERRLLERREAVAGVGWRSGSLVAVLRSHRGRPR